MGVWGQLTPRTALLIGAVAISLGGCGRVTGFFDSDTSNEAIANRGVDSPRDSTSAENAQGSSVFDLFENPDPPNTTIEVNKYLWNAALDVLNFLPIQSADPFSGVIVTGFGTPPGGGRAYRATIYVRDPALEARSLNLALVTRRGRRDHDARAPASNPRSRTMTRFSV